jgi:D-alanyl-D-alanine dipeptidase
MTIDSQLPMGAWLFLSAMASSFGEPAGDEAVRGFIPELAQSRQLMIVTSESWDAVPGTAQLFERAEIDAPWRAARESFPVVVGRKGMAWGIGCHGACTTGERCKKEGDGRSPAGVFRLGTVFGYATTAESGVTKMPYLAVTGTTEGVDDSASRFYNRVVDAARVPGGKDWKSAEQMLRPDGWYRWGVIAEHNWDGRSGFGSCIFLHIWQGNGRGTSGCTAMKEEDLTGLVQWLDRAKQPLLVQLPKEEYGRWRAGWQLPGG